MDEIKLDNELSKRGVQIPIFFLEETASTNDDARLLDFAPFESAAIVAGRQSGGRGRLGRSFFSPPGGVYLSFVYFPRKKISHPVTLSAALAVCKAVENICGVFPEIKWPNDILLGGKKLCGILTESVTDSSGRTRIIVGVGLNVNTGEFPEPLSELATSLKLHFGKDFDEQAAAAELTAKLCDIPSGGRGDLKDYRKHCSTVGKRVSFKLDDAELEGRAENIADDGALCVRMDNGELTSLRWGEISVRNVVSKDQSFETDTVES